MEELTGGVDKVKFSTGWTYRNRPGKQWLKQNYELCASHEEWVVYPLPLPLTGSTELEEFPQLKQNPLKKAQLGEE